ncbi:hypothetical protein [Microbacterium halophytorum]|uniref:hypothetical protein n=1 Tax=Microbacterium halophytorum TaxID=2067568 RepID=UPI000CFA8EDD|nr:hypothetical protein [Microbacterium halophytorum]
MPDSPDPAEPVDAGVPAQPGPTASVPAPVSRDGDIWLVGPGLPPTWRLAVWAGDGATLWWDAGDPDARFGAIVTDAATARAWIGEACGSELVGVLSSEAESAEVAITPDAVFFPAARDAALARWRQAWWPASRERLIPPLDPRLLAAELADALRILEPISSDAPTRAALEQLAATRRRFGTAPVDRPLYRAPDRTRAPLSGTVAVDLSRVANGVADAAAEARWHIVFRGAFPHIVVELLAAPRFANAAPLEPDLHASFADAAVKLTLEGDAWRAEQPVPLTMLTSPPADRTLVLWVPGTDTQRAQADAAELIRVARARLIAPTSPSERDAAARAIQ